MTFKSLQLILSLFVACSQLKSSLPCGVPRPPRNQLVVNGWDTVPGQWPWHVAVYHRKHFSDKYLCGGTLIGEWFVLTAAHCLVNPDNNYQLPTAEFFVRLGVHNLNRLNKYALQEHAVDRIFKADKFNPQALRDDIALLRLGTKADFDQWVQPACLNQETDLSGQRGTAIGWGLTEHNSLSAILKGVRMPVIEDVTCLASDRDTFGNVLDEGIFCAGYRNGTAVCNGDSGGGLFFQRRGAWYVGGVISFSTARKDDDRLCNTEGYGAFTKVSKYVPWIRSVAGAELVSENDESSHGNSEVPSISVETTSRRPLQSYFTDRPQTLGTHGTNNRPALASTLSQSLLPPLDDRDRSDGFVKHEWSSHSVDEDPQTGDVIRRETRYNITINRHTETGQSEDSNIDDIKVGPLISTLFRNNPQLSDDKDWSRVSDLLSQFDNGFGNGRSNLLSREPSLSSRLLPPAWNSDAESGK